MLSTFSIVKYFKQVFTSFHVECSTISFFQKPTLLPRTLFEITRLNVFCVNRNYYMSRLVLITNGASAFTIDAVARSRFAFVASCDNKCTKIVSKREYAKTIVATVVDPILTSFCNCIKAVRTLAAAKLSVPCDIEGSWVSRLIYNCPKCVLQHDAGRYNIGLAPPWCTHCVWHTAYYWPWAHNKLLGKLSALLSVRDVRSRVWSEGPHCGAGIGYTIIDLRAVLCAFDYRKTRHSTDEQIVIEFVTISH